MIDKVVILSNNTALIIYSKRAPVVLSADTDSNIRVLVRWIITPDISLPYTDYARAIEIEAEDTEEFLDIKAG